MKKILRLVMVLFVSIGLCACSNADEEPQVREVIDNYFTSIQSGDYQTAMSYYTADVEDGFGIKDLDEVVEQELTAAALGEDFDNAAKDWLKYTIQNTFDSYNIDEVTFDSDTATVIVSGKGLDFEQFNSSEFQDSLITVTNDYVNEHMNEMQDLYLSQGEEAATNQLISDLSNFVFGEMKTYVDNIESKDYKTRFTLVKEDTDWKISNIEHTMSS
ncbi:hypothetical protein [Faecalitalea cylindroides]|jgi:hypothetical protein|uniref:hypothetical protein n=1 Tax=Faecalitalea cylindroides TaxID=39483 RepID=UPI000B36A4D8|nr:hypothetical protein [Faecalitalea cylindroides]OUN61443.1 hypothetical protein B5G15_05500 [Faecalitalea cylindroides]